MRHELEEELVPKITGNSLSNMFQEMIKLNLVNDESVFNNKKTEKETIIKKKVLNKIDKVDEHHGCHDENQNVKVNGEKVTKKVCGLANKGIMEKLR